MFAVGDVIAYYSEDAGKRKYHLCISFDGHYVFLNSPKNRTYAGDFIVPCSEFPYLPVTDSGHSIVSCTLVMKKSDEELRDCHAKRLGCVSKILLRALVEFVRSNPVLSEEEKEIFLNAAGDWI